MVGGPGDRGPAPSRLSGAPRTRSDGPACSDPAPQVTRQSRLGTAKRPQTRGLPRRLAAHPGSVGWDSRTGPGGPLPVGRPLARVGVVVTIGQEALDLR